MSALGMGISSFAVNDSSSCVGQPHSFPLFHFSPGGFWGWMRVEQTKMTNISSSLKCCNCFF